MFCPKCGAIEQRAESYCTRCGQWLPDMDSLNRPRLLRNLTPDQRIRKMRVLEVVSAAFSIMSAIIILSVRAAGTGYTEPLTLAAICCFLVAAYQVINFYLGYKLHNRTERGRTDDMKAIAGDAQTTAPQLNAADTNLFMRGGASATENTTELLDPLPRKAQRDR
jgi:hypothetical protein